MSEKYRYEYLKQAVVREAAPLEPRAAARCLYAMFVKKLYEEGCPISAKHVESLAQKEENLFDAGTIHVRFCNDKDLVFEVLAKMEAAEKLTKLNRCDGRQSAFQLLLELLQLFDPVNSKFEWLLRDAYAIILEVSKKALLAASVATRQHIAEIYFSCAEFYYKDRQELNIAAKHYERTLRLAKGETWKSKELDEMLSYVSMRTAAARNLCELFIEYSKKVGRENARLSIDLSKKALAAAAHVGIENVPMLYWNAYLNWAENLTENLDFAAALEILLKIPKFLRENRDHKYDVKKIKLQTYTALCYIHLGRRTEALEELNQALPLAVKKGFLEQEAEIYCCLGKLHSQRHYENTQARLAFEKARGMYEKLGDTVHTRTCQYLLANMNSEYRWALQMELQKQADTEFCSKHALLKWRLQCKPYWTSMGDHVWKHKQNECYCLLEEGAIRASEDEEYCKLKEIATLRTKMRHRASLQDSYKEQLAVQLL